MTDFDCKDVFLKKDDDIIGLHAIGIDNTPYQIQELDGTITDHFGFMHEQIWGNKYNRDFNMIGGSFRVHTMFDEELKSWLDDGWTIIQKEHK